MKKKISLMHEIFGENPIYKCKNCIHLKHYGYYKCECYGFSSSNATDWALSYTACGLFNKPYDGEKVFKRVRQKDAPFEGQISLFDIGSTA